MDFLQRQYDVFIRTPGVSPADVKFADQWLLKERSAEKAKVDGWMKQRRAANLDKGRELAASIRDLQEEFAEVKAAAQRGIRPHGELMRSTKLLGQRREALERLYESLSNSEMTIQAISDDPSAYLSDWYSRFPALAHQRTRLDVALAEDRRKRLLQ